MRVRPDFETFSAAHDEGRAQVLWTTFVADLETPVSVMLKLGAGRADSILFESVEGGSVRGRYSIIGIKPDLVWRCRGNDAEINRQALTDRERFEPCAGGALDSLRAVVAESRIDLPDDLPPMAAGLVGYMSYDTVRLMEKLPDDNPDVMVRCRRAPAVAPAATGPGGDGCGGAVARLRPAGGRCSGLSDREPWPDTGSPWNMTATA